MEFPPIDPFPEELILTRVPYAKNIVVYMPSGDSYKLSSEKTERFLKLLGCEDPCWVTKIVWNMYAVWVSTLTWRTEVVPRAIVDGDMRESLYARVRGMAPIID